MQVPTRGRAELPAAAAGRGDCSMSCTFGDGMALDTKTVESKLISNHQTAIVPAGGAVGSRTWTALDHGRGRIPPASRPGGTAWPAAMRRRRPGQPVRSAATGVDIIGAEFASMKVVLFCGGLGTRIRDYSENVPKPMVPVGHHPILWHIMQYYGHYGHRDFVLCLGYKANVIKQWFLDYRPTIHSDFVISEQGTKVEIIGAQQDDWRAALVDTGIWRNIGDRLNAVKQHVIGEEMFLANYSDGLSDVPLTGDGRLLPGERQDRLLPRDPAQLQLPSGRVRRQWRCPGLPHQPRFGNLDQRRLLHLHAARSSSSCGRARSWWSSRSSG